MKLSWIRILSVIVLAAAGFLSGCGNNKGSSSGTAETGDLVIGLTDAAGDFLVYEVDIKSIALTRSDGAQVETLPVTTRAPGSRMLSSAAIAAAVAG